ncbi:sigma-70 family RNA polymerase sigma factor [Hyphomonas sp. WL0036]|uniref:sigma-70 family RNA polymerase sigma factor n=1 Tax=Hyphomonas sediminis TaxID=2866160 RepID=UPI001C7F9F56|nr:sigma-70 family RNA polymerase sigma factor [Hyphomonas sediminis]MBY9068007.1 sigma-70 family RNA polymerase sigma factor [Hyphomonas sediminis]
MSTTQALSLAEFKAALIEVTPHLRAFARSLCGDPVQADDLVQDALLKAWNARESYTENTSFKAWTFTILRNAFYSEKRRSWRSTALEPGVAEATLVASDNPDKGLELVALRNALEHLPQDQREAIILVGAGGMAYEEAAEIVGCAVGTIKSRVSRARKALAELLDADASAAPSAPQGANVTSGEAAFNDIMDQVNVLSRHNG